MSSCVHEVSDSLRPCSPLSPHAPLVAPFHFFLHLKFVDNLLTPHKESMDLSDETYLRTSHEPNAFDFKDPPSSPVCFAKLTDQREDLSVSLCPTERGYLMGTERGDLLSKVVRKHRLGLCSTNKKSKFLPSARQKSTDTNFQAVDSLRSS